MTEHEIYIRQTYQIAKNARDNGNHPFGALLTIGGEVILTAENTVNTDNDITRHAELNLVSKASRELEPARLIQSVLYTSTEPCAMCAGAIFWSGISAIVYGCSAIRLGEITGGSFVVPCRNLLRYGKRPIMIAGPILEDQGAAIHADFW